MPTSNLKSWITHLLHTALGAFSLFLSPHEITYFYTLFTHCTSMWAWITHLLHIALGAFSLFLSAHEITHFLHTFYTLHFHVSS